MKTFKKFKSKITKPVKDFLGGSGDEVRGGVDINIDPPSRPQSSIGIGSSEPAPVTHPRRNSDGIVIHLLSALTAICILK